MVRKEMGNNPEDGREQAMMQSHITTQLRNLQTEILGWSWALINTTREDDIEYAQQRLWELELQLEKLYGAI
jgi:hypothetical protein